MSKKSNINFEDFLISASEITNRQKTNISLTPFTNYLLSGGLQSGTISLFSGKQKTGKSSLALTAIAEAQKEDKPCYYFDVEYKIEEKNLKGIPGLDAEKLNLIQATEENIFSAEEYLRMAEQIFRKVKNSVVVIDSLSALCTESEQDGELTGKIIPGAPRLISNFLKRNKAAIAVNNVTVICILQIMKDLSSPFGSWVEDSGQKIQYHAQNKLLAKYSKEIVNDKTNEIIGQKVFWECYFSANGPPHKQKMGILKNVQGIFYYGTGYALLEEAVSLLTAFSIIKQNGAYYTLEFMENYLDEWNDDIAKEYKFQGMAKLMTFLESREDVKEIIFKECKQLSEL